MQGAASLQTTRGRTVMEAGLQQVLSAVTFPRASTSCTSSCQIPHSLVRLPRAKGLEGEQLTTGLGGQYGSKQDARLAFSYRQESEASQLNKGRLVRLLLGVSVVTLPWGRWLETCGLR